MMYVSLGTLLASEIKGLIDSVNNKFYNWSDEEPKVEPKVEPKGEPKGEPKVISNLVSIPTHNVSEYPLGRKSPRPFWNPNTHD